jgi:3-deoxy-manno-octulosonate cytidylyltransferase (CMP-KDO synthetase)
MKSARFPGKVLADVNGMPMIWHVYQGASRAKRISGVIIITDSQEVFDQASSWGAKVLMTEEHWPSGTARIASVADKLEGSIVVNVQGDEPLISGSVIDLLIENLEASGADIATPVFPITNPEDVTNPNVVKVVRGSDNNALYFSRSPIPHVRDVELSDWPTATTFWGHTGVYAYRREVLLDYLHLPEGIMEKAEKLEQLRLLEAGRQILTVVIDYRTEGVDTPADLEKVKKIISNRVEAK